MLEYWNIGLEESNTGIMDNAKHSWQNWNTGGLKSWKTGVLGEIKRAKPIVSHTNLLNSSNDTIYFHVLFHHSINPMFSKTPLFHSSTIPFLFH